MKAAAHDDAHTVLVVDDIESNREMLSRRLKRLGYGVELAESGERALEMIGARLFDLVLLDIMMPGMDGYAVLEAIKAREMYRDIPVVMISALDEVDSVVRCIDLGAEDYLTKPFNPTLLKARIGACLERKRLLDQHTLHLHAMEAEKQRSDELLRLILPPHVAEELKSTNTVQPRRHEGVAVLFCDIVGFTPYCESHNPEEVLRNLGELFGAFEDLMGAHGMDKINSVGDEFLAACGLTDEIEQPVLNSIRCGLDMIEQAGRSEANWNVRVGISYGAVLSGVVGHSKFLYGLWGDTVNTAARMQSHGVVNRVNVSKPAWVTVAGRCEGESRGMIEVKGKGAMELFRVDRVVC